MTEHTVTSGPEVIQGAVSERGCGSPTAGDAYWSVPVGKEGVPIDMCLLDPPMPLSDIPDILSPEGEGELRLSAVGVQLFKDPITEIWHVLDVVGREHYPEVWGFWAEARELGVSRKLPRNLDFGLLTPSSRLWLAHARAFIHNWTEYQDYHRPYDEAIRAHEEAQGRSVDHLRGHACPRWAAELDPWGQTYMALRGEQAHEPGHILSREEMCVGLWAFDLDPREYDEPGEETTRLAGSTRYRGYVRPEDIETRHELAFFASLPLHNITVYDDPIGQKHLDTLRQVEAAEKNGVRTRLFQVTEVVTADSAETETDH